MAEKSVLIKDGAMTGALTVTASSTTYSVGIDLDSQESALLELSLVVELSDRVSSGSVVFELMGDTVLPIDVSSTTIYTGEAVAVDGNVILSIPASFGFQFVGVKCIESGTGTFTANTFLNVPNV